MIVWAGGTSRRLGDPPDNGEAESGRGTERTGLITEITIGSN